VASEKDLYQAQLDMFLDPFDPQVIKTAREHGVPDSWLEAAQQSPVYKMAMDWKVAFPLHPEYRTLPMVWYIPPLSPIQSAADVGKVGLEGLIPDVDSLRIPVKYLANLLTAGDEAPVTLALKRMLAMRVYKRRQRVEGVDDASVLDQVGLTANRVEEMYQVMAIANYEDRFVIPTGHREVLPDPYGTRSGCGFTFGDGCNTHGVSRGNLFGSKSPERRKFALPPGASTTSSSGG
jgi:nitrate reductase beta subunit